MIIITIIIFHTIKYEYEDSKHDTQSEGWCWMIRKLSTSFQNTGQLTLSIEMLSQARWQTDKTQTQQNFANALDYVHFVISINQRLRDVKI